jgi:membrane peptidoglycan carboxypeptidase
VAALSLFVLYEIFIVKFPGDEISLENIQKIFSIESPVYYDDGKSIIGVFFQEEHRSYVPYERLPRYFIQALVAAEDKRFFSHPGFDPIGILRALYLNIKAGRIVHGGSTITQQTAKNLFKRQKRSLKAKVIELIRALKLEAHYSKEQILEWYVNQFYVSGNGRGVGIAAQYFFNKPVEELSLVECAFLAGSVKAPNRYNPFIQKTERDRRRAVERAVRRTRYVLRNMLDMGFITREQFEEALSRGIPFRRGRVRYPLNAVMDEVRQRLNRPAIQEALLQAGVDNIATSGIKIYTTINRELQQAAQAALRRGLSELETRLQGYQREKILERYREILESQDHIDRGPFGFGEVVKVISSGGQSRIMVRLEDGRQASIGPEGLRSMVKAYAKWRRGPWAKPTPRDLKGLLDQIKEGDTVFVYLNGWGKEGVLRAELMQYPQLNGGVLVVRDGFIKAMVGGVDNIHFNRAMDARRQVGSVFKPLVFAAALQLGWNNLDALRNRWHAFPYQGRLYIPYPDHESPHEWVSMTWAGAKSENIATVWLLYHLCDKLSLAQLKELAASLDMAPRPGESKIHYIRRIRDEMGIVVNEEALLQTAFELAREDLRTDLIFQGRTEELRSLDDLHYGLWVERYLEERGWSSREDVKQQEYKEWKALMHNFLRLRELQQEMLQAHWNLKWQLSQGYPLDSTKLPLSFKGRFYWKPLPDGDFRIVYTDDPAGRPLVPLDPKWIMARMEEGLSFEEVLPVSEVWVDGALPSALIDQLQEGIQRHLRELKSKDPYALDTLCRIRDFRVAMGLRYVVRLAQRLGVRSRLEPVLSLPLGANSITMEDAALLYEGLITGVIYSLGPGDQGPSTFLIQRIEGPEGEIIYEAKPQKFTVLPKQVTDVIAEILRKVITVGTGRKARDSIFLEVKRTPDRSRGWKVKIPVLGKTGTSDEFRNSSFVGFIPWVDKTGSALGLDSGVVISAYVGYDDNRPMKNKSIRIFGASGALPIWLSVANSTVKYLPFEDQIDLIDLTFRPEPEMPIEWPTGMIKIPVDPGSGLPRSSYGTTIWVRTYGKARGLLQQKGA